MQGSFENDWELVKELHKLCSVKREITKPDGEKENDAEHTCMVMLMIRVFKPYFPGWINFERLYEYALLHDVVEIKAGDTWYLGNREGKYERELAAAGELFKNRPDLELQWRCYEMRIDEEALYAKIFDVMQAVTALIINGGKDWKARGTTREVEMAFSEWIHKGRTPFAEVLTKMFDEAIERDLFYTKENE